jgi:hypothetical protein
MAIPAFIASLRARVGTHLLLVPTAVVLARDEKDRLLLVQDHETGLWGPKPSPQRTAPSAAYRECLRSHHRFGIPFLAPSLAG